MLAGIHDIYAEQKSEYSVIFQYYNSSDAAINIGSTYSNVKFVVTKSSLPQDSNLFEISQDGTIIEGFVALTTAEPDYGTLSVSTNQITINVNTATMTKVYPGNYFYSLLLEKSSGEVDCLLKGKFVVEAP